jgi:hypothetical protein
MTGAALNHAEVLASAEAAGPTLATVIARFVTGL